MNTRLGLGAVLLAAGITYAPLAIAGHDPSDIDPPPPEVECVDQDGDGYLHCIGVSMADCNDHDASVHPGAPEVCTTPDVDNDCDGYLDDGCPDTQCDGIDNNGDGIFDNGCPAECGGVAHNDCPLIQDLFAAGPIGFGQRARGGRGGRLYYVTNFSDNADNPAPGSLRYGVEGHVDVDGDGIGDLDAPLWIRFRIRGTILLDERRGLRMSSNKTIDGRGTKVTLKNVGISINTDENVIIENIEIKDSACTGDDAACENPKYSAINVARSHDVWLDHLSLSNMGDALSDVENYSTDVTLSWIHYSNHNQVALIYAPGKVDVDLAKKTRITFHHNFFDQTCQRQPSVNDYAKVHLFNNVWRDWGNSDVPCNAEYAVGTSTNAQVLLENNFFDYEIRNPNQSVCEGTAHETLVFGVHDADPGLAKAVGNMTLNYAGELHEREPQDVFDPRRCNEGLEGNCYEPVLEPTVCTDACEALCPGCFDCDTNCRARSCQPMWDIMQGAGWRECPRGFCNTTPPPGSGDPPVVTADLP